MQIRTQKYTVEEYLKREEISLGKNEYRDGEIVPMTGGTTNNNEIAGNFYLNFKLSTKGHYPYSLFATRYSLLTPHNDDFQHPPT